MSFFNKQNSCCSKNFKKNNDLLLVEDYISRLKELTNEINEREESINSVKEDFKKMFNIFPDMMILIDNTGMIFDANHTASEILTPILKGPIIGKKWKDILYKCNIKWEKTIEKKYIDDRNFSTKSKEIYFPSIKKHLMLNMVPVLKEKDSYFILIAKDITNVKLRELDLLKKQELLVSIDNITNVFSHNLNINYILDKIVEILGRVDKVDSCYIYQNHCDAKDNIYAEKTKEWNSGKGIELIDNFYYKLHVPRWLEFFKLNHIVCGQSKDFPDNERMFLERMEIKSICVVPIYTPLTLWGFLGFNSYKNSRYWKYDEEKLLKIAANIIGGGIYQWELRNNKAENLTKSCISF